MTGLRSSENLFYFWDGLDRLPKAFKKNIEFAAAKFPHWSIRVLSDKDAPELLQDDWPEIAAIYDRIWIPACRSDIMRLAALWKYGGWYIDCDTRPVGDLERFDGDKNVIVFRDTRRQLIKRGDVMNGFLYMPARSSLAAATLRGVVNNITKGQNLHRVMDFAGPGLLAACIKREPPERIERLWQRHVYERYNTELEGTAPLFAHTIDASASSWRILQGFGVYSGVVPDWEVFPKELRPRFADVLRRFASAHGQHDAILALADARPAYLNRPKFVMLVEECEAAMIGKDIAAA